MEWKDIWITEPPRNEEILFMIGNEEVHIGEIFSLEKLRKCRFYSFLRNCEYECDSETPYEQRVIYWFPIPQQPERSKREDIEDLGHDFVTVGCTDHRYCIKCHEEDHVIKSKMMRCSELHRDM